MPLLPDLTTLLPNGIKTGSPRAADARGESESSKVGKAPDSQGYDGLDLAKISNQERNAVKDEQSLEKEQDLREQLEKVKTRLNEKLSSMDVGLKFQVNKDLNKVVVSVVQRETGKVIRQVPPEEMLKLAENLQQMSGLLVNTRS
jgi:flagellar protein FlaG